MSTDAVNGLDYSPVSAAQAARSGMKRTQNVNGTMSVVTDAGGVTPIDLLKAAAALANADATVNPGTDAASEYTLPGGTLSTNRTLTLGTTGSPPSGLSIAIIRRDLTANTYAIVNGGGGAGTLLTFAASPTSPQGATFKYDGANWSLVSFYFVAA